MLKAAIAVIVLLVLGMVGFVVRKEMNRPVGRAVDEDQSMVIISTGQEVAIERHIASKGLTIVEFYGDF